MDGGEKQSAMARELAFAIKQRAAAAIAASHSPKFAIHTFQALKLDQRPRRPPPKAVVSSPGKASGKTPTELVAYSPDQSSHQTPPAPHSTDETEVFLTTLYLETVFPTLFPWYKPSMLSRGRSWLLSALDTNAGVRHAALALGANYFTLVLARDAPQTLQLPCGQYAFTAMAKHRQELVHRIHQHVGNSGDLFAPAAKLDFADIADVLNIIAHALVAEASISDGQSLYKCLTAGLALVQDALQPFKAVGKLSLDNILAALEKPPVFDGSDPIGHLRSNHQACFQFTLAVLLYADIISSVALKQAPRLQDYYSLLAPYPFSAPMTGRGSLHMEDYFGCHGWALSLVGRISALHSLNALQEYRLTQGQQLQDAILTGLGSLGALSELPQLQFPVNRAENQRLVTKMWLHAAWIYLSTVMHGWQTQRLIVYVNMNAVLHIAGIITKQLGLRCPIWPFCIAACMSNNEQEEQQFKGILDTMPPFPDFGANKEALNIMELAWWHRRNGSIASLDISDCLRVTNGLCLFI